MNLTKTKLYKVIEKGTRIDILKASRECLQSGKDPNLRHPATRGNLLHHIAHHATKFCDPEMLTVVYGLACMQVDVDVQDVKGDTALHCVVRHRGAYRIMVALIRCGIDTSIRNCHKQTAEDILRDERPPGHEEMMHWYLKFKPGLWCELMKDKPDVEVVERLLQSWCRQKTVKNGYFINMQNVVLNDFKRNKLRQLLKRHEHTVELVMALLAGCGTLARKWIRDGTLLHYDVNTQDISYQIRYPDFAPCPQSLLVATWQTNNLDSVRMLMELRPDTCALQTSPPECTPQPLIFQLFKTMSRPKDAAIIQTIIEKSDIFVRNHIGQTLLFEAISSEEPLSIIQHLLNKGIDLGARDCLGRTARDLADQLDKQTYINTFDEHVIKLVKSKDFCQMERLLLDGYEHLTNIRDTSGRSLEAIAKKFSSDQIHEIVQQGPAIQRYVRRIFQAVEEGNVSDLHNLVSCKKYAAGLDICGRTPLLRAFIQGRRNIVMHLVTECPFTVNMQDTLGRTALHYAYLFIDDPDMINILLVHGANPDIADWRGRLPKSYQQSECGKHAFLCLKREVLDADLDVYAHRTRFGESLHTAIQEGDLPAVDRLVSGLEGIADVTRYSHFLFECVALCREDIAVYLIQAGFRHNIFKNFTKCKPKQSECLFGDCPYDLVSLKERALKTGCGRVVKLINALNVT